MAKQKTASSNGELLTRAVEEVIVAGANGLRKLREWDIMVP